MCVQTEDVDKGGVLWVCKACMMNTNRAMSHGPTQQVGRLTMAFICLHSQVDHKVRKQMPHNRLKQTPHN